VKSSCAISLSFSVNLKQLPQSAVKLLPCRQAVRRFEQGARHLGALDRRFDRGDNSIGDIVLHLKNVIERTVEMIRPQFALVRYVHQRHGGSNPLVVALDRPAQKVADAELRGDLLWRQTFGVDCGGGQ